MKLLAIYGFRRRGLEDHKRTFLHVARISTIVSLLLGSCAAAHLKPVAGQPFENSLSMKFVPIQGTNVLFSIWETRVRDFEAFVKATGYPMEGKIEAWKNNRFTEDDYGLTTDYSWRNPGFIQGPDHPVCAISWYDARAFCRWLTQRERAAGQLGPNQCYRLPTDEEWSLAVGLPKESGVTMAEKNGKIKGVYPWGTQWPPPKGAGNYCDDAIHPEGHWDVAIPNYYDDYMATAPVGKFSPNRFGIYDLGGNVWEWCEDEYMVNSNWRVLRGGSFRTNGANPLLPNGINTLLASHRPGGHPADHRYVSLGFRVVCAVESSAP